MIWCYNPSTQRLRQENGEFQALAGKGDSGKKGRMKEGREGGKESGGREERQGREREGDHSKQR